MTETYNSDLTLVLYPNTFGIGFVLCQNPQDIVDFGLKCIRKRTFNEYQKKAKWLIEYASPRVVLLLDYNGSVQRLSKRQEKNLESIREICQNQNITVKHYSRRQIMDTFSDFKAFNKYDIAMTLIRWYPQLKSREPHKREPAYKSEHYQMGVFDAFSLMITHYYLQ